MTKAEATAIQQITIAAIRRMNKVIEQITSETADTTIQNVKLAIHDMELLRNMVSAELE